MLFECVRAIDRFSNLLFKKNKNKISVRKIIAASSCCVWATRRLQLLLQEGCLLARSRPATLMTRKKILVQDSAQLGPLPRHPRQIPDTHSQKKSTDDSGSASVVTSFFLGPLLLYKLHSIPFNFIIIHRRRSLLTLRENITYSTLLLKRQEEEEQDTSKEQDLLPLLPRFSHFY